MIKTLMNRSFKMKNTILIKFQKIKIILIKAIKFKLIINLIQINQIVILP